MGTDDYFVDTRHHSKYGGIGYHNNQFCKGNPQLYSVDCYQNKTDHRGYWAFSVTQIVRGTPPSGRLKGPQRAVPRCKIRLVPAIEDIDFNALIIFANKVSNMVTSIHSVEGNHRLMNPITKQKGASVESKKFFSVFIVMLMPEKKKMLMCYESFLVIT
uniref:Uncharacterized protein n=1 Tax=Glossina pallidipes TaxID=7398 RepID=A0A1A9Z214_GLOPL